MIRIGFLKGLLSKGSIRITAGGIMGLNIGALIIRLGFGGPLYYILIIGAPSNVVTEDRVWHACKEKCQAIAFACGRLLVLARLALGTGEVSPALASSHWVLASRSTPAALLRRTG